MWILFLLLMCGIANADVYIVTNSSHNVYAISSQNDIVVPSGDSLAVMRGQDISNLPISGSPQLYNFNNGAFSLNATAVTAQQQGQEAQIAAQAALEQARANAIAKLTDAISKVATQDVLTQQEMEALLPS